MNRSFLNCALLLLIILNCNGVSSFAENNNKAIAEIDQLENTSKQNNNQQGINKVSQEAFNLYKLGSEALEAQNLPEATAKLTQAIELDSDNALYHNEMGYLYYLMASYEKSIEEYNKAIELKPNYPTAYNNLASVYDEIGDYNKAIELYEKVISIKPNYAIVHNNMAFTYIKMSRYKQAMDQLNKAISIDPEFYSAYSNMGLLYTKKGDYKTAIEVLSKAKSINPGSHEIKMRLWYALFLDKNFDEALMVLNDLMNKESDSNKKAQILNDIGVVYTEKGNYKEALSYLNKAMMLNDKLDQLNNNMGYVYFLKKDYKTALTYYEKELTLHPGSARAYNAMGMLYKVKRDYPKAIENFTKAIELDNSLSETYKNLSDTYKAQKQYDKAISCLEDYIHRFSDATDKKQVQSMIFSMLVEQQENSKD